MGNRTVYLLAGRGPEARDYARDNDLGFSGWRHITDARQLLGLRGADVKLILLEWAAQGTPEEARRQGIEVIDG